VVEFLLAGATTVQVGTQNFVEPNASMRILDELAGYLREEKISDVRELIGALRV
jgi:dihydroorotate dehydrogenase (NAD+) catalytic subunit